ncbi:MBL fold metallo-hydrolase [Cryobacterium melibiosiphilum]|uniref:MBL fold metallo-hydrolase n=1 Tax=Cryobacterium melibiosiphilum TaxID=995039 RepID=A0A3A5MEH8_9MICO|nr:MBL fold metallo-hydrolase [Cryobacterium melibiosiphilum]RJT85252.1 MBL fold metallo-hydrolase [Cryobacterium melibiosiphilum]
MLADGIHSRPAPPPPGPPTPALERTSGLTRRLLAPNAGPMTLDGTNSYLIAAPDARDVVVVDPGPLDEPHLARLAAAGPVALVLITHHHADHTAASLRFAELTGARVRALDPAYCVGGDPLQGGELIEAAGVSIRVLATPGHTADSVCFHLPGDGPNGAVLTGDTVLGRGTTVVGHPDSTLREYLASLAALRALGPATVLPAHGPVLPDLAAVCAAYLAHRHDRLDQVRRALAVLGPDATLTQVTDLVYFETDAAVRVAAEASVRAQLDYLAPHDR